MLELIENQDKEPSIRTEVLDAWTRTLIEIQKIIQPQYFQSFILPIKPLELRGSTLVLAFPERFYRDWVNDHYYDFIQEKFHEQGGQGIVLELAVEQRSSTQVRENPRHRQLPPLDPNQTKANVSETVTKTPSSRSTLSAHTQLNTKYGFETFVVGGSNQFAHAAAFTVAEGPGKHYNPLFIYGGVGLGKTHLLNAIGLKIQEKFPQHRIHYTTFEKFTNHMIESIRFERMEEFRERYRKNCDVLIIDDIQFISGKERTQEEFFHTFNSLYEHHKQIVLSSDRQPKEIEGLEDRLRSRFEMGLIVDIQAPEMETRVAIVFKKAEVDGIQINDEVAFYLAKIYRSNIRELEGALLKLSAFASLTGSEITIELAHKVLKEEPKELHEMTQDPEEIMKIVARHFQVTLADLRSDRKNRQLAVPRQLAMYLCRKYSHLSLPDLGNLFGGKNHTTVLHAVRRIQKLQQTDHFLRDSLVKLETTLRQTYA